MFRKYLTEEEQTRLLKTIAGRSGRLPQRDHAWIRLMLFTGMRLTEARTLTVGDVLSAQRLGYLHRPASVRKGGKRAITIHCTAAVLAALQDLLAWRSVGDVGQLMDLSDPLIVGRDGAPMTSRAFQQRVDYWAAEAGLPERVTPHWFRHTRAMRIMKHSTAGDPRGIVQAALGHASISSTGIYTAPSKEDVARTLDEIDGPPKLRKRDVEAYLRAVA